MEILIAMAVVAVVLGIALPMLSRVWSDRLPLRSIAAIRQHGAAITAYTADARDMPPAIARRVDPRDVGPRPPSGLSYFDSCLDWPALVYPRQRSLPSLRSPFQPSYWAELERREQALPPEFTKSLNPWSFTLSCSFFAAPAYWNQFTRQGPHQWRVMPISSVRFPSSKGLLLDENWYRLLDLAGNSAEFKSVPRAFPLLTVDGAVNRRPLSEYLQGYFRGDGFGQFAGALHDRPAGPGQHTESGVEGRDF